MPSRNFPVGAGSVFNMNGMLGTPTVVNLVTKAAGTAQNGYKAETDLIVVGTASASHTAVTLPDPFLQGWSPGDFYEFVNATTQACVIFPPTGGNINNAGANASVALAANKAVRVYVATVVSGASTFSTLTGA